MKKLLYMRKLLILFIGALILVSCSTSRNATSQKEIFTSQESELILSGKINEPMRVLLITNPQDSLVLRTKSSTFHVNSNDKVLNYLVERMYATVRDSASRGVGIAAPQVGILKRIIWVQRLDKENKPFEVYFNPEIKKYSDMKQDVREGCLSIPNYRATTQDRAYAIFLEYDDRAGSHKCEMVEAFTAAIFQHEIDHLDGMLFIDHLLKEKNESIKHNVD